MVINGSILPFVYAAFGWCFLIKTPFLVSLTLILAVFAVFYFITFRFMPYIN